MDDNAQQQNPIYDTIKGLLLPFLRREIRKQRVGRRRQGKRDKTGLHMID